MRAINITRPLTSRQRNTLQRLYRASAGKSEPRVVGWRHRGPVVQTATGHVRIDRMGREHDLSYDQLKGVGTA